MPEVKRQVEGVIPDRIWLPLYIMKKGGPIHTKIKLQKLTFLMQVFAKIDTYNFETHHYGPYSQTLNIDTLCYPSLIAHEVNTSSKTHQSYYTFQITDQGEQRLNKYLETLDQKMLSRVDQGLKKYSGMSHCQLLEQVYSSFAIIKEDSAAKWRKVHSEMMEVKLPLQNCYENHNNRQSVFLLSTIEIVEMAMNAIEPIQDTTQRGVVMNLCHEIIHHCKEIAGAIIPPVNSDYLKPYFVDISEIESYLREYCDTRKILKDPLSTELEETMTEDEAERVAIALQSLSPITE